jgi:hypothetical protein
MDSGRGLPKGGVPPFGHPRINDRSHLPAAFRSVPRPSSPLGAKASTERPFHAPDRNRHRPHAGPSRAQRRARAIPHERPWRPHRPRAHTLTLKTTQPIPDSPVKEQKPRRRMMPARPVFWKRPRCGRTAEAARPIPGHPDARRHRTPAARASRHVRHEQDVGASRVESGARRGLSQCQDRPQPGCVSIPRHGPILERR